MSEKEINSSQPPDRGGGKKKVYAKPTLNSEPIYETLALACAKRPSQGAVCNASPQRS
jgi:hypothetical protein